MALLEVGAVKGSTVHYLRKTSYKLAAVQMTSFIQQLKFHNPWVAVTKR